MEDRTMPSHLADSRSSISLQMHQRTKLKYALVLLAFWFISTILLQTSDGRLVNLAGGETKLDLRFGYDLQTVQNLFESYGTYGRQLYVINLVIDSFMPLFLALTTVLFIALTFRNSAIVKSLTFVPLAFFFADILENLLLYRLLTTFPVLDPGLVQMASNITRPKLIAAIGTYGLLVVSALIIGSRYALKLLRTRQINAQARQ
jgi:hypothetical protein